MATTKPKPQTTFVADDAAIGPTLQPCARCGTIVCWRVWHHGTKERAAWWEVLAAPVTAALGFDHHCAEPGGPREA